MLRTSAAEVCKQKLTIKNSNCSAIKTVTRASHKFNSWQSIRTLLKCSRPENAKLWYQISVIHLLFSSCVLSYNLPIQYSPNPLPPPPVHVSPALTLSTCIVLLIFSLVFLYHPSLHPFFLLSLFSNLFFVSPFSMCIRISPKISTILSGKSSTVLDPGGQMHAKKKETMYKNEIK